MSVIDFRPGRSRRNRRPIRGYPLERYGRSPVGPHGLRSLEGVILTVDVPSDGRKVLSGADPQHMPDLVRHHARIVMVAAIQQDRAEPWLQVVRCNEKVAQATGGDTVGSGSLVQHEYDKAVRRYRFVDSFPDIAVNDLRSTRGDVCPEFVHDPTRPGLSGALHPNPRLRIDILREPPVEFDVQRSRRTTLPLSVGDPVPLADDYNIFRLHVPQHGPGSDRRAVRAFFEQGADRRPALGDVRNGRQAQRAAQALRVVPVIEQVFSRRVSPCVGSEKRARTHPVATSATASEQDGREQSGDGQHDQRFHGHGCSPITLELSTRALNILWQTPCVYPPSNSRCPQPGSPSGETAATAARRP